MIATSKRAVLLAAVGLFFVAAGRSTAAGPELQVNADSRNLLRQPDQYFDRQRPPKPMKENEAAFTEGVVRCRTEADAHANVKSGRKNQPCVATITVEAVTALVTGDVTVNIPYRPEYGDRVDGQSWEVLKAHEEGHAQIYREVFERVAQPIADAVFAKCPKAFNISISVCTDDEIRARMDQQLDVLLDALTAEAVSKITAVFREVNEAYDRATNHGRQGVEGTKPSIENQLAAAREAIQYFKQQARY
ncbi:MAG TPA: hypothetical protein VI546_00310 [candidate division Zixibacteria bacterium]|nr:hypothetical protein [candidate division Zixibacteria bacterium]